MAQQMSFSGLVGILVLSMNQSSGRRHVRSKVIFQHQAATSTHVVNGEGTLRARSAPNLSDETHGRPAALSRQLPGAP